MNELCIDAGWGSINKQGEQLCGDHVQMVQYESGTVIVLADGLGSGVKASILSTLTAKIIATMVSEGMKLDECVATVMQTLPVCSVREIAYSTFTVLHIQDSHRADIIQYDNPGVVMFRDGQYQEIDFENKTIAGKQIQTAAIRLQERDTFLLFSDGAIYAGLGSSLNFGWKREDIINYMEPLCDSGFTAKTLTTILLEKCERLYGGKPGDDTTICTLRLRRREPMNIAFGPPVNKQDCSKMMALFFSKQGKHIVSGGTTSNIAAEYLGKPLEPELLSDDPDIPPTAKLDGTELVSEGVITMNRVLEYAKDYVKDNESYSSWGYKKDGASRIARLLFEEATDINFYVGKAINPAHQNPNLPINFNIKMQIVEELSVLLQEMGKRIKVSYF